MKTTKLDGFLLIGRVWRWEEEARRRDDVELRRKCWTVLEALYGDDPRYRSPERLQRVREILDEMKETDDVKQIREFLSLPAREEQP